ncbi:MAG: Uma2 family endonuclease [Cyanobacteria bacterium SBLK]|nr:Uma2 family endonuclease [Cyanobacteria bacterium SBLK]
MVATPVDFSPQEYLDLERNSNVRHEYRRGLVYAMAGGSDDHDEISLNLIELMRQSLRDRDCSVRSGNVKVNYINDFYYYPDAFVTCDSRDRGDRYIKRYPKLIAEVLSPSTAAFDCGVKFADYQNIASFEEYILIDQEQIQVECRRRVNAVWKTTIYRAGDIVQLTSIGLEFAIAELYRGVSWVEER